MKCDCCGLDPEEIDAEVRADERAKVLAGFVEQRSEEVKYIDYGDETSDYLGTRVVTTSVRRLVGPWQPIERGE